MRMPIPTYLKNTSRVMWTLLLLLSLATTSSVASSSNSDTLDILQATQCTGYAGLAIGVPYEGVGSVESTGAVDILYGSTESLTSVGSQHWHQDSPGVPGMSEEDEDQFGKSLAAGDFDGDGYVDLAVGVPEESIGSLIRAGSVRILHGSSNGLVGRGEGWNQDSGGIPDDSEIDDQYGYALAAGDFNNDGFADLAVGAPGERFDNGYWHGHGAVTILYGSANSLTANGSWQWYQDSPGIPGESEIGDYFGYRLTTGDFNNDSFSDLAVGVPYEDIGEVVAAGAVNVLYGSGSGLTATDSQMWHQNSSGVPGQAEEHDNFGNALTAGDIDGDGFMDLAVGVPGEDVGAIDSAGAINTLYGSEHGLTASGSKKWDQNSAGIPGTSEEDDQFGTALAAGDFDGDGFADVAIGVRKESIGDVQRAGAVNVLYGSADGLTAADSDHWHQDRPDIPGESEVGDLFGAALAAGDFNEDGYLDLAVGAHGENIGAIVNAGSVNILYGSESGLTANASQHWHQNSMGIPGTPESTDEFGYALASGYWCGAGYVGTPNDDQIYFGYCDSCYDGTSRNVTTDTGDPGVVVCRITDSVVSLDDYPLGSGVLRVQGLGGHDYIQAVNNAEIDECDFKFDILSKIFTAHTGIRIEGGSGNDFISGSGFDDELYGGTGNDYIIGSHGDDELYGGDGNDHLKGSGGNDWLYGDAGDDYVYGDQDNDHLFGENDTDSLPDGNDILIGGTGDDQIDGGPGSDTFVCRYASSWLDYDGVDPDSDCNDDPQPRENMENEIKRNPYREWAPIYYHPKKPNRTTHTHLTTSSASLLWEERAAGASILANDRGSIPITGDFDSDGLEDDTGIYYYDRQQQHGLAWLDFNHSGTVDSYDNVQDVLPTDRPVIGDFDRDGDKDDLAVFSPGRNAWHFSQEGTVPYAGRPSDIPVIGDFDRDGYDDDVAMFRPSDGHWYFDNNRDGTPDHNYRDPNWLSNSGIIPLSGDFDSDGVRDDVGLYYKGLWFYDNNHDGVSDGEVGPWGMIGDIPFSGDFDGDGFSDDVGYMRMSTAEWFYDYNHNGGTDHVGEPWGDPGEPLHTIHKQFDLTCGPASLNIVMEYFGLVENDRRLFYPRDLKLPTPAAPINSSVFPDIAVDVGHHLSMEHIMYEGYHKHLADDPGWDPGKPVFMDSTRVLNTATDGGNADNGAWYQIPYDIGEVTWDEDLQETTGKVQNWTRKGRAVGSEQLPAIANKYYRSLAPDARFVWTTVGVGNNFRDLTHLRATIRGLVDHGIPVIVAVEDGGHFNTVVGYWDQGHQFSIYTADPLDGWGRPVWGKPMRWRRIPLSLDALTDGSRMVVSFMMFGHTRTGCYSTNDWRSGWALEIDKQYESNDESNVLCGNALVQPPPTQTPLPPVTQTTPTPTFTPTHTHHSIYLPALLKPL